MEPITDQEREIARQVDERAKAGHLPKMTIADIAVTLPFMMSRDETKFLVRYVIWRRDNPLSAQNGEA